MGGDWETLCSEFCLHFFPNSKLASLQRAVLTFRQLEEESFDKSWECFNELILTGPDLGIPEPILLQHFYMGLGKESRESLDLSSGGAFLHLPTSEARAKLEKFSETTRLSNELSEEEEESSPEQEEEVLIAKTQSLQSQDLVVNPKPSKSQIHDLDSQFIKMFVNRCKSYLLSIAS
jgi:hypothetical protein